MYVCMCMYVCTYIRYRVATIIVYVCMYVCMNRHPSTMEGVIPMVELMLSVLHFVIRAVSESSAPISKEEKVSTTTTTTTNTTVAQVNAHIIIF